MQRQRARVLVVDNAQQALANALEPALRHHDVEVARDAFDAIYRIDCAGRPHDVIFCDLACDELPGPELWAFLKLSRARAAERMVFVASAPLRREALSFLQGIPNVCVQLPAAEGDLHALMAHRAGPQVTTTAGVSAQPRQRRDRSAAGQ